MKLKYKRIRIGLRTIKTAAAVIASMAIVTSYGASTSKLIFAMLGAMAAMEPSFKASLEACFTQIVGMFVGALIGIALLELPLPPLFLAGIGIILVITVYNIFQIRFSPSLPCLIVATLCTTTDLHPFTYALTRLWDTAIGLGVGMIINTLIFPYDNTNRIRVAAECLNKEIILFLEDMYDGDDNLPNTEKMTKIIDEMKQQLTIFSKQWLLLHFRKNKHKLEAFSIYERKARQLIAQMEVLCFMQQPGMLNKENRERLIQCGAEIKQKKVPDSYQEIDIITNYHVEKILNLREDLLGVTANVAKKRKFLFMA